MTKLRISGNKLVAVTVVVIAIAAIASAMVFNGSGTMQKPPNHKTAQSSPCGDYRHDGKVRINGAIIDVETPRNTEDFAKGLAGRPCILDNQGMLFAFKKPGQYPIWMKGMKFPIDVVWVSADRKVAAIEIDFQPSTYPDKQVNKIPAQYVLELKANRSKELHMQIGTPVQF